MNTSTAKSLAEFDLLLGPALRHTRGSTRQRVLAVLTAGLANGMTPRLIQFWLTSRGDSEMQRYVASYAYRDCVSAVRLRLRQPPVPAGGARRLVGHLLTPTGDRITGRRAVTSRAMLAVVGLGVIDNLRGDRQMDTWMTTGARLGVTLGMSTPTVAANVKAVENLGWAKRRRVVHRGPSTWALRPLRPAEQETAERLHDVVAALAEGEDHPTADLVRAIHHPAVAYGDLLTAWLVALADSADRDPVALGVGRSTAIKARRAWRRMLDGHDNLISALDAHDQEHGCTTSRDAREAARVAEVEQSARDRARHTAMVTLVDHALGDIPKPDEGGKILDAWLRAAETRARAGSRIRDDLVSQARRRIEARMTRRGFGPGAADQVAKRLVDAMLNQIEAGAA